jgi:hypothetical protein
MHNTSSPKSPSWGQVFLGLFIVGQLFFLLSTNLIGFLTDYRTEMGSEARQVMETLAPGWLEEKGHVWHLLDHLAKTDKMWAQATGQLQIWSLFAPTVGRECVFPAVELRWDEDPLSAPAVARPLALMAANNPWQAACFAKTIAATTTPPGAELVLSANEPVHPEHYLRFGNFRLRRYEANFVITLRPHEGETPAETNERWSGKIRGHVADYGEILHGYLRRRVGQAMAQWPGREQPRQVILFLRRYHINDYEEAPPFWQGPDVVPLARWQPAATWGTDYQPLEWYDPLTRRFKSLHK